MSKFDVNGYNSHECDIHNHGYYLGAQSQQAKIDELQARIDGALRHVVDHGGYDDLTHVISILKGNKNETTV